MNANKFPVIFSGHGDPMIALRDDEITQGMKDIAEHVTSKFGRPEAILSISAHWYVNGTFVQDSESPEQIYDMYGFPKELYEVKYPVKGSKRLTSRVIELLGGNISINNEWGIDHGSWTVLVHMFPEADIPVVQLSINRTLTPGQCFELGEKLQALRDEKFLIFGSGNVVHNLRRVEWNNPGGSEMAIAFNQRIIEYIESGNYDAVIDYKNIPDASYAVPTPDHFMPLIYCLGAAGDDKAKVFNNVCNLGSMAMTGFAFGLNLS